MRYYLTDKSVAQLLRLTHMRAKTDNGLYVLNGSDLAPLDIRKLTSSGDAQRISLAEAKKLIKKTSK